MNTHVCMVYMEQVNHKEGGLTIHLITFGNTTDEVSFIQLFNHYIYAYNTYIYRILFIKKNVAHTPRRVSSIS